MCFTSPSALMSCANCRALMPHAPISSYSQTSAVLLAFALMLYQLWLSACTAAFGFIKVAFFFCTLAVLFCVVFVICVRTEDQLLIAVGFNFCFTCFFELLWVAAAGARHFGFICKACFHQNFPCISFFARINPWHYWPLIHGAEDAGWIHINRNIDLTGCNGHCKPCSVNRSAPVINELMLQQVVTKLGFNQLLALGAVSAVVVTSNG